MNLAEAFKAFPDIARPIVIKSDLLRLGVRFGEAARANFRDRDDILFKGSRLFGSDRGALTFERAKLPHQFYLEDGTPRGTLVQTRVWEQSPYVIDHVEDKFTLFWNGGPLMNVWFQPRPKYYERTIDGIPMREIVFATGDKLFLPANRFCEYFVKGKQCLYCDLTPFAQALKKEGEPMVLRKAAEQAAVVLEVGFHDPSFRHLTISGGTFFTKYQGKTELEWYTGLLDSIRARLKMWYPTCFQLAAQDDEGWRRVKETGVPSIGPNIEVWDQRLFEIVCPGKAEYVGYDQWIRRTVRAVDFWGAGNVNPSFVLGVEMAQPFGFKTVAEAVKSTLSGYDFLMANGVLPRQGEFWCVVSDSSLAGSEPPPLEYFLRIGMGYLELREKHGFACPPAAICRSCGLHGTEYDFEYWHGNGPSSRKAESGPPVAAPSTGAPRCPGAPVKGAATGGPES
ncbi:MAG: hypothetical protein HY673_20060 [Chloroflexi bacterium]|nr:hypothetical protein [Chloroflexota bacterium]